MKASDNKFPGIILNEAANDGSDFSNPDADYRRLFLGEDGQLHVKDSSGTVTDIGVGSGAVATDTIWDAAGDLAVGSGSNTAVRLAIGAAGGALTVINSAVAWNSGTSFPANKATGDRYWRTDLGLECYWDGTRWVTTQLFNFKVGENNAISATNTVMGRVPVGTAYGIWFHKITAELIIGATNTGSAYWELELVKYSNAAAKTQIGTAEISTAADSASVRVQKEATIDAEWLQSDSDKDIVINALKTSTPSNLWAAVNVIYRLIVT